MPSASISRIRSVELSSQQHPSNPSCLAHMRHFRSRACGRLQAAIIATSLATSISPPSARPPGWDRFFGSGGAGCEVPVWEQLLGRVQLSSALFGSLRLNDGWAAVLCSVGCSSAHHDCEAGRGSTPCSAALICSMCRGSYEQVLHNPLVRRALVRPLTYGICGSEKQFSAARKQK